MMMTLVYLNGNRIITSGHEFSIQHKKNYPDDISGLPECNHSTASRTFV